MAFININDIREKELIEGAKAKFIHSENMTAAFWTFEEGVELPSHSHMHEQITKLISGSFQLTVDGETKVLGENDIAVIPADALHSGKALKKSVMMDVFSPVREDYK